MKTLHLSIITGIGIVIVVTTGLVLTLSSQNASTSQESGIQKSNYSDDIENAVEINSAVRRTVDPEKPCFFADDDFLASYPTILHAISDADLFAKRNQTVDVEPLKKYYSGEQVMLSQDQVVTLLSKYDFNRTTAYNEDNKHIFKFKNEYFTCGFDYENKNYDLLINYYNLVGIEKNIGYTSLIITNRTLVPSQEKITYGPFNNTLVFNNTLDSKITFTVTTNSDILDKKVVVPAHQLSMLYLNGFYFVHGDLQYHYQSDQFAQLQGDILVKKIPICLGQEMTRSLYVQSDLKVLRLPLKM